MFGFFIIIIIIIIIIISSSSSSISISIIMVGDVKSPSLMSCGKYARDISVVICSLAHTLATFCMSSDAAMLLRRIYKK